MISQLVYASKISTDWKIQLIQRLNLFESYLIIQKIFDALADFDVYTLRFIRCCKTQNIFIRAPIFMSKIRSNGCMVR